MSTDSSYTRYSSPGNRPGTITVRLTRPGGTSATATVRLGTVVRGKDKQPHLGRVTVVRRGRLTAKNQLVFKLRAPRPNFRVEVNVSPTFRPIDVNPTGTTDARHLGAQVTYTFTPAHKKR